MNSDLSKFYLVSSSSSFSTLLFIIITFILSFLLLIPILILIFLIFSNYSLYCHPLPPSYPPHINRHSHNPHPHTHLHYHFHYPYLRHHTSTHHNSHPYHHSSCPSLHSPHLPLYPFPSYHPFSLLTPPHPTHSPPP
ncbi:uncharacterized histidine-rich protein DDB_G0274557-like [Stegodyphus dumicola]|uniref:uncharacterized histidine-rich protein DDB_G0274557-like n=1 Tax=Stegodyphus dumicola TaxID=202533 RepID=UPI0015B2DCDD|nr:uncharacterized histidine-rich protein DDB_G0274557-like [Stegodyphus dumicola]